MRKLYFVGLAVILMLAAGLIGYGTYLNKSDESQIAMRMENRTIPLQGEKVQFRNLQPVFVLNTINLTSDDIADAVALIDGRIENFFITKNSSVNKGQVLFELVNEDIPIKIQQADSESRGASLSSQKFFRPLRKTERKKCNVYGKIRRGKIKLRGGTGNFA